MKEEIIWNSKPNLSILAFSFIKEGYVLLLFISLLMGLNFFMNWGIVSSIIYILFVLSMFRIYDYLMIWASKYSLTHDGIEILVINKKAVAFSEISEISREEKNIFNERLYFYFFTLKKTFWDDGIEQNKV